MYVKFGCCMMSTAERVCSVAEIGPRIRISCKWWHVSTHLTDVLWKHRFLTVLICPEFLHSYHNCNVQLNLPTVNCPGTQQNIHYTEVFTQEDHKGFDMHASSSECYSQHNRNTELTSQISLSSSFWIFDKFLMFPGNLRFFSFCRYFY